MKKFKFRLDSYLKVCRYQVDAEVLRLKELLIEKEQILQSIDNLNQEVNENENLKSSKKEFSSIDLRIILAYLENLRFQIHQLIKELAELEAKISSQRNRLLESKRRLKPVEKLKERRREHYEFEAERNFQSMVDELYLLRLNRNSTTRVQEY